MKLTLKISLHLLVFAILTVVTQIGGIIYIIAIFSVKSNTNKRKLKKLGIFTALYLTSTFLIVPNVAPYFGREKIKDSDLLEARSFFYVLANRNYVRPALNESLNQISVEFEKQNLGIKMIYLDANFPFINGFPLLPHLSHKDGKKVDVSLIYENSNGQITNKKPSMSGYGVYESPKDNEHKQNEVCKTSNWYYDFPKYLTFGTINKEIKFSNKGTKELANLIVRQKSTGKLFIEPHLKKRLKLTSGKVRFHGCHSVRHDDHIHFQLK